MSENKLPTDWKYVKLSEIGKIISGGTPSTSISEYWEGSINWIAPSDLTGYKNIRIKSGKKSITELGLKKSSARLMPKGSVLFSSRAPIGYTVIADEELCTNQGFKSIIPYDFVDSLYIYYFLKASKQEAEKVASGTTFKEISLKSFSELSFPLPTLKTQQTIVSKIEELFSELDKGIEDLKTAQQQLKTYRQSVLNLLATNENLMPIEKIINKLDQGWSPKCENHASIDKTQWAVIKTSAIQQGYFVEIENKILPTNLNPKEQHEIEVGDILITRAGPRVRVGICCMVKHTRPKLINCDKVYRIKVNRKLIQPEYFEYILNTPKYQDQIEKMKSGISDSGLNLTQKVFVKITIPVPTLKEQHKIVQEIESRLSVADKMEESIAQSLQQAEALRQSILKKAFSGELI